ncbi:MAG: rhodanese-like domain-containing protein, partial [Peristeroidobacter soli]
MVTRLVFALFLSAGVAQAQEIPNPLIDYAAFQSGVESVGLTREKFRVSERQFVSMAADPETIILDARSAEKFALLHV